LTKKFNADKYEKEPVVHRVETYTPSAGYSTDMYPLEERERRRKEAYALLFEILKAKDQLRNEGDYAEGMALPLTKDQRFEVSAVLELDMPIQPGDQLYGFTIVEDSDEETPQYDAQYWKTNTPYSWTHVKLYKG